MTNYTKLKVNFTVLIIFGLILYMISNFTSIGLKKISNTKDNLNQISNSQIQETEEKSNNSNENQEVIQENNETKEEITPINTNEKNATNNLIQKDFEWQIEIPKINLKAEIKEGTGKEVMNNYVGHFTETGTTNGNVGLAAHNRGYKVNYFKDLKKLKQNDEIIYKYKDYKKTYIVKEITVIKDTNWTYLENTDKNIITLITCVENEPEYRRCIQGVERK